MKKQENKKNKSVKSSSIISRIISLLANHKGLLTLIIASVLISDLALLYAPKLVGKAIDVIIPNTPFFSDLIKILISIGIMYSIGVIFNGVASVSASVISNKVAGDLRVSLFKKVNNLPLKYLDSKSRGDIMSRFSNDVEAVADGLNQGVLRLISAVITIILCLVFMFTINVKITFVVVLITPISFIVGYIITKKSTDSFRNQSYMVGKLNGYAEELISGQNTVKAFGYEKHSIKEFDELNEELYEYGYKAQFASAMTNPSTRFVTNSAYVLVGVVGIFYAIRGLLTKGGIASFLSYTVQYAKPFNDVTSITMQIQLAIASAQRIFVMLDEEEQLPDKEDALVLDNAKGSVNFETVKFGYNPSKILIEDFTLDVKPGTMVAIVGPTGAGKTTLINLLMRFYEVNSGNIYVDDIDIHDITRDSLRRNFGMVLQETWLFAGTIRDNIAYGNPDSNDEDIESAARLSNAHGFIRRLPKRYDTKLTQDGGNLSQGQKQLLTIARTMLLDSPMLILDEATSSVDILTEQRIQKAFKELMRNKTSFVIAHRLSTIKHADLILVLDKGNVVERGTHKSLLEKRGFYHHLYYSQFAPTEK